MKCPQTLMGDAGNVNHCAALRRTYSITSPSSVSVAFLAGAFFAAGFLAAAFFTAGFLAAGFFAAAFFFVGFFLGAAFRF